MGIKLDTLHIAFKTQNVVQLFNMFFVVLDSEKEARIDGKNGQKVEKQVDSDGAFDFADLKGLQSSAEE